MGPSLSDLVLRHSIFNRLSDQGHEVVGNEAVDLGCRQFFEEHNIPYKTETLQDADGVVYKVEP